jgi:uncharacterized protein (TIGR03437 family)
MKVSIGEGPNDASAVHDVPLADYASAIYEFDDDAVETAGQARDQNLQLITGANPAVRRQEIRIYASGLGPVDNVPPSGLGPAEPMAKTRVYR